jgi:cellulose synthase/poly-beta-1,6-N-acetylglucosamine synthase-like glycosyltransferase
MGNPPISTTGRALLGIERVIVPLWLIVASYLLLAVMVVKVVWTLAMARRYHAKGSWRQGGTTPSTVSVIVPAFNEEATLANNMRGLDRQTWHSVEVIVVDDGSTDRTAVVATQMASQMTTPTRVISKANGGKADALNAGLQVAKGEIVVCVDADSVLHPEAIERVLEPFADETIGAVGGIVKIANQNTVLGRQQAMEYISGLTLQRAAFAEVDSIQVLSGAISAFRREALQHVGGYSDETIVEDFDVTVAVRQAGYRTALHPDAVAYTEGPLSVADLVRQRHRWTYGGFQVLGKYRHTLFTNGMGRLSRIGLPYFLVFPWFDVAVSLLFALTLGFAVTSGDLTAFLTYFGVMSALNLALNLYAVRIANEDRRLALWGMVQPLFYAHILTLTTARAGVLYLAGRDAAWHKLVRAGHNEVPASARGELITVDHAVLAA